MTENEENGSRPSTDQAAEAPEDRVLNESLKKNVKETATWMRFLFMLVFAAVIWVTSFVMGAVVLLQFLTKLFTGNTNKNLQSFGNDLSVYVYDMLRYLTFNTEDRPFPFGEWKSAADSSE